MSFVRSLENIKNPQRCKMMKLDHIGIAVRDLDRVLKSYQALGLKESGREIIKDYAIEVCMIELGESKIELIQPLSNEGLIAKFLQKRGEGIHHVAIAVEDIEEKLAQLKAQGIKLIDEQPRQGFSKRKIVFLHPESMHGVLIELVEE